VPLSREAEVVRRLIIAADGDPAIE